MPVITTDKLGLNDANPKPVRHINWCGQPMKEGDNYWGESAPQPQPVPPPRDVPKARVKRVKRSWTATQLEAMRTRMATARAAAKEKRMATQSTTNQGEN